MPVLEKLQNMEKKYALTFFSLLLAVVFGAITVYTSFFQDKRPHVRYEVLSKASVYDIRENVSDLEIKFKGDNIRERGETLTLITFRVANKGSQPVLPAYFDDKAPLGFELQGGVMIKPELIGASSAYLASNLTIITESPSRVTFPKVILNEDAWFAVKVLILHKEGTTPNIKPIGEIAGAKPIDLVAMPRPDESKSFWRRTYGETLVVQVVRLLTYPLGLIICIALIVLPIVGLTSSLETHRRNIHVRDFKSITDISLVESDDSIFQWYVDTGYGHLKFMEKLVTNEKMLSQFLKKVDRSARVKYRVRDVADEHAIRHVMIEDFGGHGLAKRLTSSGFVTQSQSQVGVNQHMLELLQRFLKFLEARGVSEDVSIDYRFPNNPPHD